MSSVTIDARELPPPEPLERVLAALPALGEHDTVTLLLPREPFPLYSVLRQRGFAWKTSLSDDGTYTIVIRR